jgi:hypothetical protein
MPSEGHLDLEGVAVMECHGKLLPVADGSASCACARESRRIAARLRRAVPPCCNAACNGWIDRLCAAGRTGYPPGGS